MQFASKKIRNQVSSCTAKTQNRPITTPYTYFHNKNKQKYRQCLSLIENWSQDLLLRENNVHKQQKKYVKLAQECQDNEYENSLSKEANKENKCSSMNSHHGCSNSGYAFGNGFDLEEILGQEFVKKMESLYMKQFMLRDFEGESHNRGSSCLEASEGDSLNL